MYFIGQGITHGTINEDFGFHCPKIHPPFLYITESREPHTELSLRDLGKQESCQCLQLLKRSDSL